MTKRVIVMNFEMESLAYQGFSELKRLAATGQVKGEQMAVVTHSNDGQHKFKIEDFVDFTGSNKTSTGGLIGMLVGILVGPLTMLLGWVGGSMIGATQDAREIKNARNIFEFLVSDIAEGQTGLILIAEEEDNRPINEIIINQLRGGISRFDYQEVEEEIKKAQQVEKDTKNNAQQAWQKQHDNTNEETDSSNASAKD
ncbi:DUF1269 domain-containing protein [Enterococcus sp. AD013-P3]|uniref:DUF1269 domain-containing protein n=1 Tax=Enterococcus sp. AD013-P3 TaxID=3411036 RepID=UPI003B94D69F